MTPVPHTGDREIDVLRGADHAVTRESPRPILPGRARGMVLAVLAFALLPALVLPGLCAGGRWGVAGAQAQARKAPVAVTGFDPDAADVIFQQLSESNGVANPVVTSFAEDGDGFLWVGTQSGLQRWDGYRFWTYKTALNDGKSIPDNYVTVLYADRQGRLWVGTSSGGLARYDRHNNWFVRYRAGPNDLSRVNIYAITGDGGDGLWIGSDSGLDHLDTTSGTLTHAEFAAGDARQPQAKHAIALARTADGTVWAGTERGLERSIPGNASQPVFQRVPLAGDKGARTGVNCLFVDSSGTLWAGTQHGAFVVDAAAAARGSGTLAARAVSAQGPGGDLLTGERYLSIAETSQGEIWLGTQDQGILAVTPGFGSGTAKVRRIVNDPTLPTSLSDDRIGVLYLGKPGVMWVGTRGKGISYLDTTPKNVFTVFGGAGRNRTISDTDIYSILARPDGSAWLALSKNGIDILDSAGHLAGALRPQSSGDGSGTRLPKGPVSGLADAGDGGVYICAQQGLYRAEAVDLEKMAGRRSGDKTGELGTPRLTRVPIGNEASVGITRVVLADGKLWIGGNSGVWTYDPKDGKPAARPRLQGRLTDERVDLMQRGAGRSLWVGTDNGLNRIDLDTLAVEAILPDPSDPEALGAGLIASVLTDKRGRLWVGTFSGGIDVLDHRDASGRPRFHRIIDGLPNENIDMLLEAPDGKIWAATDAGLAVIDPDTFQIRVLQRPEGVFISAYWNGVGAITRAGELLFGGIGGLTVVRPMAVTSSTYLPPVLVTDARVGPVNIPTGRFNSGLDEAPIWVPHDHDDLTVEFTALDYTAPERNRYEYKLEGFDRDWISADPTRRLARYTNLQPGDYLLQLRGSNRDGLWSPIRNIRIRVLPAWFQTTWFRVLAVMLGMLFLGGVFMLATAYLRRQQRELERQVALRTAELQQMTVELRKSQQKLEHMAYTESLTGLPNRRMFTEHFRRLIALKRRQEGPFSLLLLDFDNFKGINDTYGHDAGDAVLKEMALRMSALVRESDCLARLGGDEFGLLLAETPDIQGTEMVCQKIIEAFAEPVFFDGVELRTAPSIGVAMYPEDGDGQEELYKAADLALYQAKRNGGNGCCWSDRASSAQMQ